MKKGWKIVWIVLAGVFGVGVLLLGVSSLLGFRFGTLESKVEKQNKLFSAISWAKEEGFKGFTEERKETISGDVREVVIAGDVAEVELLPAEGEQVEVKTKASKDLQIDVKQTKDGLSIHTSLKKGNLKNRDLAKIFGKDSTLRGKVQIFLPKGKALESVEVDVEVGSILAKGLKVKNLSLDLEVGQATLEEMEVQEGDLSAAASQIVFQGKVGKSLDISCDLGGIIAKIDGRQEEFGYKIETELGKIRYGKEEFSGFTEEKIGGSEKEKQISLETNVGNVEVDFQEN